jgi:transposase-like protein
MAKVKCETCGKVFTAKTKKEAQRLLWQHCDHDIVGEATMQRARYGSDA